MGACLTTLNSKQPLEGLGIEAVIVPSALQRLNLSDDRGHWVVTLYGRFHTLRGRHVVLEAADHAPDATTRGALALRR